MNQKPKILIIEPQGDSNMGDTYVDKDGNWKAFLFCQGKDYFCNIYGVLKTAKDQYLLGKIDTTQ